MGFSPITDHTQIGNTGLTGPGGTVQVAGGPVYAADPFVYPTGSGNVNFADYQAMLNVASPAALQAFLNTYNTTTNPLPSDITQFVKAFVASQGLYTTVNGVQVPDPTVVDSVLTGFLQAFQQNMTGRYDPSSAWPELSGLITLNGDISDPKQFSQLEAAYKSFISTYPYTSTGQIAPATGTNFALTGFFTAWRSFTSFNATIKNPSNLPVDRPDQLSTSLFAVPTYEAIFNSFYPAYATPAVDPSSPTGQTYFAEYLQQFYQSEIQRYGFFSPSKSLTNWVDFTQNLAGLTLVSPATRVPEVKTKIINNVLLLLIQMISSIQNIAAAQANRLALYASWQRGYTSLLGNIHVFTATSGDRLAKAQDPEQTIRRDIQTNFNAAATQRVTSQKDVVTDDAKALQSRVNQSSDAFNEQANTCTALLQELSTILSTIFR